MDTNPNKTIIKYVRIDEQTEAGLQALSEKDERPVSHLIRTAVLQYLRRRES